MLSLFYLAACSTTGTVATFTPLTANTDRAVVYIYRPDEMANGLYSPGLNINDEFQLYIKNGINSRLLLSPGEHKFEFQAEKKYTKLKPLTLDLDAGSTYFIRVSTSLEVKSSATYEPYSRSFKLARIDEQQAIKEITECCLDSKQPANKIDDNLTEQKQSEGFSVDKTQNPFSH